MSTISLLSTADLQMSLCEWLKKCRKLQKLSRVALSERSTVPASTIKKFENSGQISLRQFLLLWQCLDDLSRLNALTRHTSQPQSNPPLSIDEVLQNGF